MFCLYDIELMDNFFLTGVEITHYTMEVLNMDTMLAVTERHIASETEFELLNLTPGGRYKARVAAENKVGLGPFSNYTKVCSIALFVYYVIYTIRCNLRW